MSFLQHVDSIEDDLDKLLTVKSKPPTPAKPTKPTKRAKPAKPVAKPRLKSKPDLKPKPTPKPRFAEAGAGEDELFGVVSPVIKQEKPPVKERKPVSGDQDLFDQARKQSFNRFVTFVCVLLIAQWSCGLGLWSSE